MQREVDEAKAQLAHLNICTAECFCALHLLKQVFRDWLSGLVVAGEQVERFALPAPVLHDLRREFHEIPRNVGSSKATNLHAAQAVMQQMAELMEDRLHFAVRQERGVIFDRRGKVSADQTEVRFKAIRGGAPGEKRVHPCTAALVLARIPIGVE